MIRVHLTEGAPPGEEAEGAPAPAADPDWKTLDDLARTALLLARRLRERQDADDRAAEAGGTIQNPESEGEVTGTALTVSDLLEHARERAGADADADVPAARKDPDS